MMEPVFSTEITKIKDGKKITVEDTLVREIKLELIVNGEKVGAVMATPVDQEALAIGYLTVSYTHLTLPTKRIV